MLRILSFAIGTFVLMVTALSLLRFKAWWIRIWDFPRLQLALVGASALVGGMLTLPAEKPGMHWALLGTLTIAVAYQAGFVWRYSRLAPFEVQPSVSEESNARLSLAVSNVLQTNRQSERLVSVLRAADADVLLCVETDDWWRQQLDTLKASHPHVVQCALANTYGMLLYSRLPLEDTSIDFLVQDDIPSIQARIRLHNGQTVWLNCVHPRPPAPAENDRSLERDAELLVVGKRVCEASEPVIVCGDLNDVAWSRTTRLFQKTSRLVDPRKGRGLFATFHARFPGLRFPLDHILHSDDFRIVSMRRLPYVGSDHFPVYAMLSLEPSAKHEQEAPTADAGDHQEASETVAEGQREG